MSIREISAAAITDAVEALCIEANTKLPADVKAALDQAEAAEPWPLARETLGLLQQNLVVAADKELPICQDTGMVQYYKLLSPLLIRLRPKQRMS